MQDETPKSNQNIHWKTIGLGVLFIAAIIIIWSVAGNQGAQPTQTLTNQNTANTEGPQVVKIKAATLLADFPQDFPMESGVENTESYKYLPAKSTEEQSTLEYVSKKSFRENKTIFTEYLDKAGFKISNRDERTGFAFYYATKDNNDLSIKIVERQGQVTVTASFLKR